MRLQVCWSVESLLGIWSTNELLAVTYKCRIGSDLHAVSIINSLFWEIYLEFDELLSKSKNLNAS
jgi:hypothetical protein